MNFTPLYLGCVIMSVLILYYKLTGPPSYVLCVIGRNVVVWRVTVYEVYASLPWLCDNERVCVYRETFY